MQLTNIPAKFPVPFASSAVSPFIRTIPTAPTGTPGQASLQTGFPSPNFSPVAAGGVPPFGEDFNGILNQATAWDQWQATGVAFPPYDPTFQTNIAGYPQTAIVSSLVQLGLFYMSIVDNNLTNPDAGGAGWIVFWRQLIANADLYVNASTGNDSNNGLTTATAKRTIGAAVTTAWTFTANSQFTVTIHVAPGTYNEAVTTPVFIGPFVTIVGSSGNPSDVLVNASIGDCFLVAGPNNLTVQAVTVESSGASILAGFGAINGASLITNNTRSLGLTGAVFAAASGGNINPGTHTVNGNATGLFNANTAGTIGPNGATNYSFSSAVTFSGATAVVQSGGIINLPITSPITFTNPGNVTGQRFNASINGVIFAPSLGVNFFPGTIAGASATGGQAVF